MYLFRLFVGEDEEVDLWPYTFDPQIPGVCNHCGVGPDTAEDGEAEYESETEDSVSSDGSG